MREKTFTNAAATVLEGAAKPESTLTFEAANAPVRKIAHWLPVTEEMLEDVAQIRSYIDARLRLGVEIEEEDQLLNGTGVAPDLLGPATAARPRRRRRVGVAPDTQRRRDPASDHGDLRDVVPDAGRHHDAPDQLGDDPADEGDARRLSDGRAVPADSVADPLGLARGGHAGDRRGRRPRRRVQDRRASVPAGGIRVEASNSHADFFIKNLVAIRAEERLALACYRPGSFGEVTALT